MVVLLLLTVYWRPRSKCPVHYPRDQHNIVHNIRLLVKAMCGVGPQIVSPSTYLINERVDAVPALLLDGAVADVELRVCIYETMGYFR